MSEPIKNPDGLYTTGEIAKLCGVSVRTVQYYDTRGILIPSSPSPWWAASLPFATSFPSFPRRSWRQLCPR